MEQKPTSPRHVPPAPPAPSDEAREIHPVKMMKIGEDTIVGEDENNVVFSDFRARVLPSDVIVEEAAPAPKDLFAPEPVDSSGLPPLIEEPTTTQLVPPAVVKDSGEPSPTKPGKQTSSSVQKSGQSEPTA